MSLGWFHQVFRSCKSFKYALDRRNLSLDKNQDRYLDRELGEFKLNFFVDCNVNPRSQMEGVTITLQDTGLNM